MRVQVGACGWTAELALRRPWAGTGARPADTAPFLQRYSPAVEAGSDVVFRWTIDDKQSLTFHNVVFNVIYQSAAIFKLSVGGAGAGRGLGVVLGGHRSPVPSVLLCSRGPRGGSG